MVLVFLCNRLKGTSHFIRARTGWNYTKSSAMGTTLHFPREKIFLPEDHTAPENQHYCCPMMCFCTYTQTFIQNGEKWNNPGRCWWITNFQKNALWDFPPDHGTAAPFWVIFSLALKCSHHSIPMGRRWLSFSVRHRLSIHKQWMLEAEF